MQKNILKEAINELGIFEGDVIKLPCECGDDYYQYKDGKLKYLGSKGNENLDAVMSDDEYIELITGRDFEIISKNQNPYIEDVRDQVSRIDCVVDDIDDTTDKIENKLNELIETQAQEKEQRKKDDLLLLCLEGAFVAFLLICLLIKNLF